MADIIIYIIIGALVIRAMWVCAKLFKKGGCSCGSCENCSGCAFKDKSKKSE